MLCSSSVSVAGTLVFFTCLTLSSSLSLSLPPSSSPSERRYELDFVVSVSGPVGEPVESSQFILAQQRTNRKDPLNGFKKYTGGWNISDHHYWASVSYTAVPLFSISAIWFIGFGLCLLVICLCHFCCRRESFGYSPVAYALSLIFLIIFTIAAIIGCVVLYIGQGKFHNSTSETLNYIVRQADGTADTLRTVSDYLASAKQISVDQVFLPSNVQTDIDQIGAKINSTATDLAGQSSKTKDDAQELLDSARIALIVISAIMLLLAFLGLLFSLFGMQVLVYILVVFGWILVAGTFVLCGIFLLLHNVAGDTCVAMNQWVQFPAAHTSLDEILPCVDNATAQETLMKSKEVTSELVEVINQVITNVSNINFSPNFPPLYINQSGPLVPILCNPFFHDLTDRACTPGEVTLSNATQVWNEYVCQVSAKGICTTTGRLTPTFYNQMSAVVKVSFALSNYAPYLVSLEDCSFVRETFGAIYVNYCPGLRQYSRWIYIGLVIVSTAITLSLIFWIIYGRERRHRLSTTQFSDDARSNKDS